MSDVHPFARTLGPGPYSYAGFCEIIKPCESIPEGNYRSLPQNLKAGMGTCAHCNHGIMNVFIVRNGLGDLYGVGSDCIEKLSIPEILTKVQRQERKLKREKAAARKIKNGERDKILCQTLIAEHSDLFASLPHPYSRMRSSSLLGSFKRRLDSCGVGGFRFLLKDIQKTIEGAINGPQ